MNEWREKELNQQLEFAKQLVFYLNGNMDAVRFCLDVLFVGHLWDDLVDGDKERTPDEIANALQVVMGSIPTNPFYQANIGALSGMMMSAIMLWQDANVLEKGNADEKMMSFLTRNALLFVVHYCLFLTGGPEWAKAKGPEFWSAIGKGFHDQYLYFLTEVENA